MISKVIRRMISGVIRRMISKTYYRLVFSALLGLFSVLLAYSRFVSYQFISMIIYSGGLP